LTMHIVFDLWNRKAKIAGMEVCEGKMVTWRQTCISEMPASVCYYLRLLTGPP
jgi:hypothetical protein